MTVLEDELSNNVDYWKSVATRYREDSETWERSASFYHEQYVLWKTRAEALEKDNNAQS